MKYVVDHYLFRWAISSSITKGSQIVELMLWHICGIDNQMVHLDR